METNTEKQKKDKRKRKDTDKNHSYSDLSTFQFKEQNDPCLKKFIVFLNKQ